METALKGAGEVPEANWLSEFDEFADISSAIDNALGIHADTRTSRRRSLIRQECYQLLRHFLSGSEGTRPRIEGLATKFGLSESDIDKLSDEAISSIRFVSVPHRVVSEYLESAEDLDGDPFEPINIEIGHYHSAFFSFLLTVPLAESLSYDRIRTASTERWFDRYEGPTKGFRPSHFQEALDQLSDELDGLCMINLKGSSELSDLRTSVMASNESGQSWIQVGRYAWITAAGAYYRAENVFVRLAALETYLKGASTNPQPDSSALLTRSPSQEWQAGLDIQRLADEEISGYLDNLRPHDSGEA